jgi:hypothetical protein
MSDENLMRNPSEKYPPPLEKLEASGDGRQASNVLKKWPNIKTFIWVVKS